MGLIALIVLVGLFYMNIKGICGIGWLLVLSVGLFVYTVLIGLSKQRVLSDFGRVLCVLSVIGMIYCFCILSGINIQSMF